MRKMMLVLGAGAMLAGAVSAEAGDRDRRDRGDRKERDERKERRQDRRHRDRDRNENVGAVAVGALLIGAIIGMAAKPKRAVIADAPPEFTPGPMEAAQTDADAAVAACAAAAEGEGRRTFALAQVGQVTDVMPDGIGYAVTGDVLLRGGWRDEGERRPFRCSVDAQAVRSLSIEGLRLLPTR